MVVSYSPCPKGKNMSEACRVAVKINDDYCGRCTICYSVCPFQAITRNEDTGEVKIDIEKCQVCGICSSACPVSAIETAYYNVDELTGYVERKMSELESENLVVTCRGSSPESCELVEILQKLNVKDFVPLRLPCVGRVPTEFIFKMLARGVKKIVAIRCEEDFCRFKKGSKTSAQRLLLTKNILAHLGFKEDTLTLLEASKKAEYDTEKCVGCDKCTFICPYGAIEAKPWATPEINFDVCVGCGACALVCPHLAIQLKGFEYDAVTQQIQNQIAKIKALKPKKEQPSILVFCCPWAEFTALDDFRGSSLPENVAFIEVPCSKGLDPVHVVQSFNLGFEGVLAVTCAKEDCKLEEGKEIAERNIAALKKVLQKLRLSDRFEHCTTSPRYPDDFNVKLECFIKKITQLLQTKQKTTLSVR